MTTHNILSKTVIRMISKKFLGALMLAALLLSSMPVPAFAVIYQPGVTLNPNCLPTDVNCGVDTSAFTAGLSIGTTTPSSTTNALYSSTGGVLYWNGSQLSGISGGISSLNGLATSTQTFAVGTAGTDFGITSSGSTHTFNLPTASSTVRGLLSSADWTTFNNKLDASTSIVTSLAVPTGSNANGGSIASNVLALSLADGTNPGLVSTGTQTFAGNKTFNGNLSFNGSTATINNVATNGQIRIETNGTGNIVLNPGSGGTVQIGTASGQTLFFGSGGDAATFLADPQLFSFGAISAGGTVSRSVLKFLEPSFVEGVPTSGNNYVGFRTPYADLATTTVWTLPSSDGTAGQTLSTNGSAGLSWVTQSGATSLAAPSGSNANGGSIASNILTLSLADATNPGLVSTGAQTFAGAKTFSSAPTISSMTAGSVLFAGTGGALSQSNSNLFWDNTNNRLGIGAANPGAGLEVTPSNTAATQWTLRSGANFGNKDVVYGNGLFVSVVDTNLVFTSPDGITWTQRSAPTASIWRGVTYGNGIFAAVGSVSGVGTVMTSPDGITWTSRTPAANNDWEAITYANNLFVAVASSGTGNRVMTSPDGITWTSRTSASNDLWRGVTYGNGLFVAVSFLGSTYGAMTSPDGITWTGRTTPSEAFNDVAFGGGLFVAVSEGGATGVATSPDGITWTSRTPAASLFWRGVTYGNGIFVAVAGSGTGNRVMTSPDGTTWTSRTSAADNNWNGIAFGNNLFVAVADSGTTRVMTSSGALPTAIAANGSVSAGGNIMPTSNNLYDLGSATNKWRDMYLSGNTSIGGTLNVTGASTLATTTANSLTLSPMTAGSLLFAGASGLVSQNNAGLFWDNTNSRLGIGTTAPSTTLAVNGTFNVTEPAVPISATGGTITTSGTYTIHTFTTSGTFTPSGAVNVEYLVVAGGGAGGSGSGAGGGAGGLLTSTTTISGATTVTVGAGGAGAGSLKGGSGVNSVFGSITATGGGGGGSNQTSIANSGGANGGSGGGASSFDGVTSVAGTGTAGQGNNGGVATNWSGSYGSGGGGGAGAVGGNGTNTVGGPGGAGLASSISGTSVTYAGGGGGGVFSGASPGAGGSGGGGAGASSGVGTAGTANTGGGAGGNGANNLAAGASGGSGIVIVRYLTSSVTSAVALNVVSSGNVGIGTNAPTAPLEVKGTGTGAIIAKFTDVNTTGCTLATGGTISCSSDVSLKKNVVTINDTLEKALALNPVIFNWKFEEDSAATHPGFIAQEVEKLFPALVSTDENGLKSLAYSNFAPILVSAMQEQFGGLQGLKFTSATDYAEVFSSTSTLDALASAKASDDFISDPIAYIRERVEQSIKIVRTLVTEKLVAVNGYFKRIFANELCLTDSSGALVCVTGDQLKNIGGLTPSTTSEANPLTTSGSATMVPSQNTATQTTITPMNETTTADNATTTTNATSESTATSTSSSSTSVDSTISTTPTPVIGASSTESPASATDVSASQVESSPAEVSSTPTPTTESTVPASLDVSQ